MSTKSISETKLQAQSAEPANQSVSAPLEETGIASYHNNYVNRAGKLGCCGVTHLLIYKDSWLPARVGKIALFAIASFGFAMYDVLSNLWTKISGREVTPVVTNPSSNKPNPNTQPSGSQDTGKTKPANISAKTKNPKTSEKASKEPKGSPTDSFDDRSARIQQMIDALRAAPKKQNLPAPPPASTSSLPPALTPSASSISPSFNKPIPSKQPSKSQGTGKLAAQTKPSAKTQDPKTPEKASKEPKDSPTDSFDDRSERIQSLLNALSAATKNKDVPTKLSVITSSLPITPHLASDKLSISPSLFPSAHFSASFKPTLSPNLPSPPLSASLTAALNSTLFPQPQGNQPNYASSLTSAESSASSAMAPPSSISVSSAAGSNSSGSSVSTSATMPTAVSSSSSTVSITPSASPQQQSEADGRDQIVQRFDTLLQALSAVTKEYENPGTRPEGEEIVGPHGFISSPLKEPPETACARLLVELQNLYAVLLSAGVPDTFDLGRLNSDLASVKHNSSTYFVANPELKKNQELIYKLKSIKNWWILLIKAFQFIYKLKDLNKYNRLAQEICFLSLIPTKKRKKELNLIMEEAGIEEKLAPFLQKERVLGALFGQSIRDSQGFCERLDQLHFFEKTPNIISFANKNQELLEKKFVKLQQELIVLREYFNYPESDTRYIIEDLKKSDLLDALVYIYLEILAHETRKELILRCDNVGCSQKEAWLQQEKEIDNWDEATDFLSSKINELESTRQENKTSSSPKHASPPASPRASPTLAPTSLASESSATGSSSATSIVSAAAATTTATAAATTTSVSTSSSSPSVVPPTSPTLVTSATGSSSSSSSVNTSPTTTTVTASTTTTPVSTSASSSPVETPTSAPSASLPNPASSSVNIAGALPTTTASSSSDPVTSQKTSNSWLPNIWGLASSFLGTRPTTSTSTQSTQPNSIAVTSPLSAPSVISSVPPVATPTSQVPVPLASGSNPSALSANTSATMTSATTTGTTSSLSMSSASPSATIVPAASPPLQPLSTNLPTHTIDEFNQRFEELSPAGKEYEDPGAKPVDEEIVGPAGFNPTSSQGAQKTNPKLLNELWQLYLVLSSARMPDMYSAENGIITITHKGVPHSIASIKDINNPAFSYKLKSIKNWWNLLNKAFSFIYTIENAEVRDYLADQIRLLSLRPTQDSIQALNGILDDTNIDKIIEEWQEDEKILCTTFGHPIQASQLTERLDILDFYEKYIPTLQKDLPVEKKIDELEAQFKTLHKQLGYDEPKAVEMIRDAEDKGDINKLAFLHNVTQAYQQQLAFISLCANTSCPQKAQWLNEAEELNTWKATAEFFSNKIEQLKKTAGENKAPSSPHLASSSVSLTAPPVLSPASSASTSTATTTTAATTTSSLSASSPASSVAAKTSPAPLPSANPPKPVNPFTNTTTTKAATTTSSLSTSQSSLQASPVLSPASPASTSTTTTTATPATTSLLSPSPSRSPVKPDSKQPASPPVSRTSRTNVPPMTPLELPPQAPLDPKVVEFNRRFAALPESTKTYEQPGEKPDGEEIVGPPVNNARISQDTQELCEQLERDLFALYEVLSMAGVPKEFEIKNSALSIKGKEIYNNDTSIEEKAYLLKSIKNWWIILIKAFSFTNKDVEVENRDQIKEDLLALSLRPIRESREKLNLVFRDALEDLVKEWRDKALRLANAIGTREAQEALEGFPHGDLNVLEFYRAKMPSLRTLAFPKIAELQKELTELNERLNYIKDETVKDVLDFNGKPVDKLELLKGVISAIKKQEKMVEIGKQTDYDANDINLWVEEGNKIDNWSDRAQYFHDVYYAIKQEKKMLRLGKNKGYPVEMINLCRHKGKKLTNWGKRATHFITQIRIIKVWEKPESESKAASQSDVAVVRPKREPLGPININEASTLEDCTNELKRLCGLVPYSEQDTNKIFALQYPNTVSLEKAIEQKQRDQTTKQLEVSAKQKALGMDKNNGEIQQALGKLQNEMQEIQRDLERFQTKLSNTRNQQIEVRREQIKAVAEEIHYLGWAEERGLSQKEIDQTLQMGRGIGYPTARSNFFKDKQAD
jgi:hypothetical protein